MTDVLFMYSVKESHFPTRVVQILAVFYFAAGPVSSSVTIDVKPQVVVQLPVSEVRLHCMYNKSDPNAKDNIAWVIESLGVLVLEKSTIEEVIVGKGYTARLGIGCTLILTNITVDHSGIYTVTVDSPYTFSHDSAEVRLTIIDESAVLPTPRPELQTTTETTDDTGEDKGKDRAYIIGALVALSISILVLACGIVLLPLSKRVCKRKRKRKDEDVNDNKDTNHYLLTPTQGDPEAHT